VGRVSERNREHIDRVLTVSAQHGLVKQESFFTKRVAAKNLSSYLVVRQGTFVYNKSYSAAAPFGVATYNKTAEPGVISPLYFTFRPNPELVLDEYLEYVLNSNTFHQQMARYIKEGGRAHGGINVSVDDYLSVEVLLPTLQEQRRVVDLVAAVDSYIAALQQQADAARSARSAVLSELLSAGGEDWTGTTLGEISELVSRGRAPSYCEDDGVVVLNQKCVRYGRIFFEFARKTDTTKKAIPEWAYLKVGDTLINSTGVGTLGRASFVSCLDGPTTFDSHVTLVRPRDDSSFPQFIGMTLNFRENEIEMLAGGSTGQTELSREAVNSFPISLPPLNEQRRIVEIVSPMDEVSQSADKAVADARNLRSGLLSELLSGAHEIPESYDRLLGVA